jgi:uncharacterized membrane protein
MGHRSPRIHKCQICQRDFATKNVLPASVIRSSLLPYLKPASGEWNPEGFVCEEDLNRARRAFYQELIDAEKGDLSQVQASVVKALQEHEVLTSQLSNETDDRSRGEKLSDQLAEFGGSWKFFILFTATISVWIWLNAHAHVPYDPFPFILLNLALSCVAALQAPIIMMSQSRQAKRDRKQNELDFKVNLKSEVEIRMLNEKVDRLISHQWQRLLQIQELQLDLMNELGNQAKPREPVKKNNLPT